MNASAKHCYLRLQRPLGGMAILLFALFSSHVYATELPFSSPSGNFSQLGQSQEGTERLGSFIVTPVVAINVYHDDNIYASDLNPTSDNISALAANIGLKSDWKRHLLRFSFSGDTARYAAHPSENYQDYTLSTNGRYDAAPGTSVTAGGSLSRNHEERGSPNDVLGDQPTIYQQGDANLGFNKLTPRVGFSAAIAYTTLNYADVTSSTGIIDNDVRDRNIDSVASRLRYIVNDHLSPFLQASAEKRTYIHTSNQLAVRDSKGYRLDMGLSTSFPGTLTGELYIGRLVHSFDNAAFETVSVNDYGANIKWIVRKSTTIALHSERSLEETTLVASSSYLFTRNAVTLDQKITNDIGFNLGTSRAVANYQMIDRRDIYDEASAGISYKIIKGATFGIDYRHQERTSNQSGEDYVRRLTICYVKAEL